MDLHASDPSLQKTSPDTDPAALYQRTTKVSAQASMLAAHHQQLQRLTSLTEEMVKTLQALRVTMPEPNIPPSIPSRTIPSLSHSSTSPRLAFPEKFDGSPERCKGFLLQCSMFVNQQPQIYPTEDSQVSFVCSLLTGWALDWATAAWEGRQLSFPSFDCFLKRFREVFEHSAGGKEPGEQLLALRQGRSTALDYALSFRTLAAQSGWEDKPLKLLYRKGLTAELQSELACRDEGKTIEQLIDLSIRIDNLMRSRRAPHHFQVHTQAATVSSESEPM